ncbi:MAG: hypothetical protein KTR25_10360 [Myxococcales bacterium]|nr:hypothetical protein [Myxococcales bacterium]
MTKPAWAEDRRLGFRVGAKSKLHLNLDLSAAMDSNPERLNDSDSQGAEDFRLVIRPSFKLDAPGRSYRLRLGAGLTVSQFFSPAAGTLESIGTKPGADARLYFRLGTGRSAVTLTVENTPILTPTVLPDLGTISADEALFETFADTGKLYLTLRPGGGALEFDVGYENAFTVFLRSMEGRSAPDDGFLHKGFFEGRLKFLPKTAALVYIDFGAFDAYNPSGPVTTLGSNPISLLVGVEGQITRTIATELRVGYAENLVWSGQRFGETAPQNQRTVVGLASAVWQITRVAQISLGYQRTLQPTVALSSFIADALRFRALWRIERLELGVYAEVQHRDFGTQAPDAELVAQNPGIAENEPSATLAFGGLRADYYFYNWLIGGLNYRLLHQGSNDPERGNSLPELGAFSRHQVFATVGVRY